MAALSFSSEKAEKHGVVLTPHEQLAITKMHQKMQT